MPNTTIHVSSSFQIDFTDRDLNHISETFLQLFKASSSITLLKELKNEQQDVIVVITFPHSICPIPQSVFQYTEYIREILIAKAEVPSDNVLIRFAIS